MFQNQILPITSHRAVRRAPAVLCGLAAVWTASSACADLQSYVKAPDDCYSWKVHKTLELPGAGSALILHLTSQKWQGIVWEHWLYVIRPEKVTRPEHALLLISGGSKKSEPPSTLNREGLLLLQTAAKTGSVIAVLTQVPNQPLFDNLKEDALIAHTFVKYLETKDDSWPCLMPMTKSAVRAMDAVQAAVKEKHSQEIRRFVVSGASKRGWTTWLTGAVDPRVEAIAPMVIDTLNFDKQMPHQLLSFGKYSEQIEDYTRLNLPQRTGEPLAKRLNEIVDPYSYRQSLSMPKLILLGTNDRYWPVDAVKNYFGDLVGEKYLHHLPNAGHGLGKEAIDAVEAFYQAVIAGEPRPRFRWSLEAAGDEARLAIACEDRPETMELWQATADTRDFRESKWSSAPLEVAKDGSTVARAAVPGEGFRAFFARLGYKSSLGHIYYLTTNVEVLGTKVKSLSQ